MFGDEFLERMCANLNFLNVYNFREGFVTELINVPRKEKEDCGKNHNKLYDVVHQIKATSFLISILREGYSASCSVHGVVLL